MRNWITVLLAICLLGSPSWADPANLETLSLSRSTIRGGESLTGTVWLTERAPEGGVEVELWSDTRAQVPSRIVVPEGSRHGEFPLGTHPVPSDVQVEVAALHHGQTVKAHLKVLTGEQTRPVTQGSRVVTRDRSAEVLPYVLWGISDAVDYHYWRRHYDKPHIQPYPYPVPQPDQPHIQPHPYPDSKDLHILPYPSQNDWGTEADWGTSKDWGTEADWGTNADWGY